MIKIDKLSKQYGEQVVLRIPELVIGKGECLGLVGNNGAGKTTLFSLMLDLIQPSTGQITINDIPVNESEDWKRVTSSFIDESFLIGYLTPEEYFYFIGELRGANKATVDALLATYLDFFNDEILNSKKFLRDFSKGNQKKVGLIASLIGNPELIIWDEPFANLDPSTQIRLKNILFQLKADQSRTILISSHDLSHTVDVSSRIVALEKGKVVKDIESTPATLKELEVFFQV